MKINTFIKTLELLNEWDIQRFFNKDFSGSCPCFSGRKIIDGKFIEVCGRCWRVSENDQDLHIKGNIEKKNLVKIARIIKKHLDAQKWYGKYTIIYDL